MAASEFQTGKRRYRVEKRCFGKPLVVLQLQWSVRGYQRVDGFISTSKFVDYTEWRDAKPEDLLEVSDGN